MVWKYDWAQWRYCRCKKKQVEEYRGLMQQELDKAFSGRKSHRLNQKKRDVPIVVSLTSIAERLPYVVYPIRCMFQQKIKPDKIVLYLDRHNIKDDNIPDELFQLKESGLEIEYVEDIGPHTKYYYALQTYGDCYVITIDDDIMYARTLIKDLLRTEKQNKGAVCAKRVRKLKFTQQGVPYPYSSTTELKDKPFYQGRHLMALGVGGVLYPPQCLGHADFSIKTILELSKYNDDIWLKVMELLNGVEVVKVKGRVYRESSIQGSQMVALNKKNYSQRNNENMKALFSHYNLYHYFANANWEVDLASDAIVRRILTEWVDLYQKGLSISDFLIEKGIHTVAIYGVAKLGTLLQHELEQKGIQIKYGIDINVVNSTSLTVVRPEEISESVDMIIVTAVTDLAALKHRLSQYTDCKIEMIENIIAEVLWENI